MSGRKTFSFGKAKIPRVEIYNDESSDVEIYSQEDNVSNKRRSVRKMRKKLNFLFISLLIVVILVLSILLKFAYGPLDKSTGSFLDSSSYDELLVRKISSSSTSEFASQINSSCNISSDSGEYVVIMSSLSENSTAIALLDRKGAVICSRDIASGAQDLQPISDDTVVAVVNGDPIYGGEVLSILSSIPEPQRTQAALDASLEQAINSKLLEQDAVRRNITALPADVEREVNSFLEANGLTLQALEQNLKDGGLTLQNFQSELEQRIVLQKLVVEITRDVTAPSEEEVRQYYDTNRQNITSLGSSTTRQLLVVANASNADQKLTEANVIAERINSSNFCDLVLQYSEDLQTRDSCGLYETQQGQLLPEYEDAVYASSPGDVKLIQSRFGYHIVQVLRVVPPSPASFEQASQGISEYILNIKRQEALAEYLAGLKQNADIRVMGAQ